MGFGAEHGMDFWAEMERPAPRAAIVAGVELRKGSRVRLRPRAGGDIFDLALAGRIAVIEGIDQDHEGNLHLAVTLEDDPGRDLGEARQPGHRFFFAPSEVEPLDGPALSEPRRILVAGIGNIFLGDDGFGVAVARRLAARPLPRGVEVVDFGIRGLDLAYALQEDYDAVILVDAAPRGRDPGTVYVIEPEPDPPGGAVLDTHGMDPVRVLRLARELGGAPARMLVVGCEPGTVLGGEPHADVLVELSPPVQAAVGVAVELIESLVDELVAADGRAAVRETESGPVQGKGGDA